MLTTSAKPTGKELSPVDESAAVSPTSPPAPLASVSPKPSTTTTAQPQLKPSPQPKQTSLQPHPAPTAISRQLSAPSGRHHQHTQGLHLVIPGEISTATPGGMPQSPTCSSGGSSHDGSPTSIRRRRTASLMVAGHQQQQQHSGGSAGSATTTGSAGSGNDLQLTNQLKAPIVVRRGPRGYGFTIRAIRVYLGESDYYTIQHLIMVSFWACFGIVDDPNCILSVFSPWNPAAPRATLVCDPTI